MIIHTPALEITVLPEVGGKVARIRQIQSQADVLIPARRAYRTLTPDTPWVHCDTSGMDDCFPNIDDGPYPCGPWRDMRLPQMGEWVRGKWQVLSSCNSEIALERSGSILPYIARKCIGFVDDLTVQLDYRVKNTGAHGFRYLWSAHPLIAAGESFSLRLPGRNLDCVTFPDRGETFLWPFYGGVDLSREWVAPGKTLKLFVSGLSEGWCELITSGRRLRFGFDLAETPVVGLWFNNYGFPGGGQEPFRCIAVEPCTSPTDILHALPVEAYPFLAPGSTARWWFSIRVEGDSKMIDGHSWRTSHARLAET